MQTSEEEEEAEVREVHKEITKMFVGRTRSTPSTHPNHMHRRTTKPPTRGCSSSTAAAAEEGERKKTKVRILVLPFCFQRWS